MSRGGKEIDFRGASLPPRKRAVASTLPSPLDSQRAHLFDEHGLKLVLGSTANVPFSKDELVSHIASQLDADDLADFESVIAMVRG